MRNLIVIIALLTCISCKTNSSKPEISQAVIQDYSNFFSEAEALKLSEKIIDYEKKTTNQICIYTIDSIPRKESALHHATTIANTLGIGTKEKDNGLLLLISRNDRKMAIATGRGTEKTITDRIVSSIIDKTIVPKFKDSLYFEGVTKGLDSIIKKW